jgi:hypothetical protein
MRIPAYLSLSRHNVFYFRWPLYGRTLRVSLRTRNPRFALHLARQLAYHAENITGQMLGMDYIEIKRELQTFFIKWLDNRKRNINQNGTLTPQRLEAFRSDLQELELSIKRGEDDFTLDESLDELLDMVIRVRKLDIKRAHPNTDIYSANINSLAPSIAVTRSPITKASKVTTSPLNKHRASP